VFYIKEAMSSLFWESTMFSRCWRIAFAWRRQVPSNALLREHRQEPPYDTTFQECQDGPFQTKRSKGCRFSDRLSRSSGFISKASIADVEDSVGERQKISLTDSTLERDGGWRDGQLGDDGPSEAMSYEELAKTHQRTHPGAQLWLRCYTVFNIDHGMTRGWTQGGCNAHSLDNWVTTRPAWWKPVFTKTLINVYLPLG
jgi:hypothetical protein